MKKFLKTTGIVILILVLAIVLAALAAVLVFVVGNNNNTSTGLATIQNSEIDYNTEINGAIYIPADDYNAWQLWENYDTAIIDRDMGYAESAGLNAIRVFTSYEYWREDPEGLIEKFENLIETAGEHGIRVMPVLFEDCGVDNTKENREAADDATGFCVCSPERAVQQNKSRYHEVDDYVDAFMEKYGSDDRLLAIEIMNEPHLLSRNVGFSKYVLKKARSYQGTVPLTMGQLTIFHNLLYPGELDIYQYHDNYPNSTNRLVAEMKIGNYFQEKTGRPFWLTEWQRGRTAGGGWGDADIPESDKTPDLKSLAGVIEDNQVCSFFWSLMVKQAYLPPQRLNGTFNGLFYADGTVYSEEDLAAIQSLSGLNGE